MDVQSSVREENIRRTTTCDYIRLVGDLYVCRAETVTETARRVGEADRWPRPARSAEVKEGFTIGRAIEAFLAGQEETPFSGLPRSFAWVLVRPEFEEAMRLRGYVPDGDDDHLDWRRHLEEEPFKAVASGRATPDDVVRIDPEARLAFRSDGTPFPAAVRFGHATAVAFDSLSFDLARAVEVLGERDVEFVSAYSGWQAEESRRTPGWPLEDVPWYANPADGRTCVSFVWHPTREEMAVAWEECLRLDRRQPAGRLQEAAMNLDLLGLRAGGAVISGPWADLPAPGAAPAR